MSDRVAVMKGGKVEQCDEPRVLYEEPCTAFVANFLGSSNLIPAPRSRAGRCRSGSSRCARTCDGRSGRGAGDDPARAGAAGAARVRRREPRAGDGRGRRLPRLPPGRARAAGDAALWSAATCPTTGRRSSTPRAIRCACTCPRSACGCWSHEAARGAARRGSPRHRSRRLRGRDGRHDHARGGRVAGVAQLPLRVQGRGGGGGVRGRRARGPGALEAISRRFEDPGGAARGVPRSVRVGGRGELAAVGGRVGLVGALAAGARHARALRRRLAGGAGRGAGGRRAPGLLGSARTCRTRRRGWSRCSTGSGCTRRSTARTCRRRAPRRGRAGSRSSSSA